MAKEWEFLDSFSNPQRCDNISFTFNSALCENYAKYIAARGSERERIARLFSASSFFYIMDVFAQRSLECATTDWEMADY